MIQHVAFGVVRQLFEGKVATNAMEPLAGAIAAASEVLSAPPHTASATGSPLMHYTVRQTELLKAGVLTIAEVRQQRGLAVQVEQVSQ